MEQRTVKCLLCKKDVIRDDHFVMDGGLITIEFGYGSRYDHHYGIDASESKADHLTAVDECQRVQAYICDDCFEQNADLCEGYKITKQITEKRVL